MAIGDWSEIAQNTNKMRLGSLNIEHPDITDIARINLQQREMEQRDKERQEREKETQRRIDDSGVFAGLVALRAGGSLSRGDIINGLGRIKSHQGATEVAGLLGKIEEEETNDKVAEDLAKELDVPYTKGMRPTQVTALKVRKEAEAKENARIGGLKQLSIALNPLPPEGWIAPKDATGNPMPWDGGFHPDDSEDSIRARWQAGMDAITGGRNPLELTSEDIAKLPRQDQIKIWGAKRLATEAQTKSNAEANRQMGAAGLDSMRNITDPTKRLEALTLAPTGGDPSLISLKDKMIKETKVEIAKTVRENEINTLSDLNLAEADTIGKLENLTTSDSAVLGMRNNMLSLARRIQKAPAEDKNKLNMLFRANNESRKSYQNWLKDSGLLDPFTKQIDTSKVPPEPKLEDYTSFFSSTPDEETFKVDHARWEKDPIIMKFMEFQKERKNFEDKIKPEIENLLNPAVVPPKPPVGVPEKVWDEQKFKDAYAEIVKKREAMGLPLDSNPDNPEHKYDYRGAFKKYGPSFGMGETTSSDGSDKSHFPSEFKLADHPNRIVNGVDTKLTSMSDKELAEYYKGLAEGDEKKKVWEVITQRKAGRK